MKDVLIQTCDPVEYATILEATSRTTREFCHRQDLKYRSFIGVKRGHWPWHSTYNRLHMLKELLDEGHRGWVLYLDADAYISDLDFPIAEFLKARTQSALIGVRANSTAEYWDINAGVLFVNFKHHLAEAIVLDLIKRHEKASQTLEFLETRWPDPDLRLDDQSLLHSALLENPDWQTSLRHEPQSLMNSMHASFIRHHLRAMTPAICERIKSIQTEVEDVLRGVKLE